MDVVAAVGARVVLDLGAALVAPRATVLPLLDGVGLRVDRLGLDRVGDAHLVLDDELRPIDLGRLGAVARAAQSSRAR